MEPRLEVGVLGATGMVGQHFVKFLQNHPWFDLTWLGAPDPSPVRRVALVSADRDLLPEEIPVLAARFGAVAGDWESGAIAWVAARRPDLWRAFRPSKADAKLVPPLAARTHLALVHHPCVDRNGAVITTALTNFDIHDLARSTMTFGLAGCHLVTPITSQREKAAHIAKLWIADAQGEHRAAALRLVVVPSPSSPR